MSISKEQSQIQGLVKMGSMKSSYTEKVNNENCAPTSNCNMSEKTKNVIKKTEDTFGVQLSEAKVYLAEFADKLQHVHYLEALRGQLKERKNQNILKHLEQ
jgi:hypothetical protein